MENILEVKDLVQEFNLNKGLLDGLRFSKGKLTREPKIVHAVNDVSFELSKGEIFALVGESGCGKSTTAKAIVGLVKPKQGEILFQGEDLLKLTPRQFRDKRRHIQMIFQDPYASLNPRQKILDIVTEPVTFHKLAKDRKTAELIAGEVLEKVGIRSEQFNRYPHQFSGGQRQRIGIARSLVLKPSLVIADEPVSALDVSIQAQILNLLVDLKQDFDLSYLFIAHNLSVVEHLCDQLGVMYLGMIVERGENQTIFRNPLHPYTQLLLSSVPKLIGGSIKSSPQNLQEVPNALTLPPGCYFSDRCPKAMPVCREIKPVELLIEPNHWVACHLYQERDYENTNRENR